MNIGDKVRFLSDVGGGKVAGFQGKNIVLVEDEDGFQVPTPINEVVVVDNDDYSTSKVIDKKNEKKKDNAGSSIHILDDDEDYDPSERPITFRKQVEERKGGELLSVYLAFVPIDIKAITTTRFEAYLVNDSNYYVRYVFMLAEGATWQMKYTAEVEPNTKVFIFEFGKEELNELSHIAIQMISYKKEKNYAMKPVTDVQLRIDPVKFYKMHTFQENDFFEQPAMLYTIIENDKCLNPITIDPKKLKKEMMSKTVLDTKPSTLDSIAKKDKNSPVVVDLHASEVLETTAGMSAADILSYQMDIFRKTLAEYASKKGTRIVFIHGKGEGVLRQSLLSELKYKYKKYTYQDASFQEYGYGATQVTIR